MKQKREKNQKKQDAFNWKKGISAIYLSKNGIFQGKIPKFNHKTLNKTRNKKTKKRDFIFLNKQKFHYKKRLNLMLKDYDMLNRNIFLMISYYDRTVARNSINSSVICNQYYEESINSQQNSTPVPAKSINSTSEIESNSLIY